MILDNRSVPVWYQRVTDPSINLTRLDDGSLAWTKLLGLAFGSTPGGAYEVHGLDGTLLRSISTVSGPTDHHDIAEATRRIGRASTRWNRRWGFATRSTRRSRARSALRSRT